MQHLVSDANIIMNRPECVVSNVYLKSGVHSHRFKEQPLWNGWPRLGAPDFPDDGCESGEVDVSRQIALSWEIKIPISFQELMVPNSADRVGERPFFTIVDD